MKSIRKLIISIFILFGAGISCTVVDTELMELVLEIKNQNEELLTEVKSLQSKSDSLVNEIKKSAAKQEELLTKVTALQSELAKVLSQIASLNEKLTSQDADLEAIKGQLADLQKKYEGILVQLEQLQKLSQILTEIEKLKAQLTDLNGKYQVVVNTLAQNQQAIDALKSQVTTLQSQLAQNLEKISQLTSQLGEQGADIDNIFVQIEALKASCDELKKLLENQLSGKSPVPTNGLVGWWPFNGNAIDESGSGNDGSVKGAILDIDRFNQINRSFSFDGKTSYIALKNTFFTNPSKVSTFTYSFWIYANSLPSSGKEYLISGKEGFWRTIGVSIRDNGEVAIRGSQPSPQNYFSAFSTSIITLKNWLHIGITFENGSFTIYINGEVVSTTKINYDALEFSFLQSGNSTATNLFGAINPVSPGVTSFYDGKLDDFAIWNRALTADEISKIYNGEGF